MAGENPRETGFGRSEAMKHMGMIDPRPQWRGDEMTSLIRGVVKDRLREYFAEFIEGIDDSILPASGEEQRFLLDVFEMWASHRMPGKPDELYIASAFQLTLGRQEPRVIHVPEELRDSVRSYVRWLQDGGIEE